MFFESLEPLIVRLPRYQVSVALILTDVKHNNFLDETLKNILRTV